MQLTLPIISLNTQKESHLANCIIAFEEEVSMDDRLQTEAKSRKVNFKLQTRAKQEVTILMGE